MCSGLIYFSFVRHTNWFVNAEDKARFTSRGRSKMSNATVKDGHRSTLLWQIEQLDKPSEPHPGNNMLCQVIKLSLTLLLVVAERMSWAS